MNLDLIWTDREIAILEEFYPYASHSELEKLLPNRKKNAIITKASKLNIRRPIYIWTEEQLSLLKKHYPSQTNNEELLALLKNHSFVAIKTKAKNLGLKRGSYIPSCKEYTARRWTKEEMKILRLYYNSMEDKDLLMLLPGRTLMGMKHMAARQLKLGNKFKMFFKRGKLWTNYEDKILCKIFNVLPNEELIKLLPGRTHSSIKARAHKLGIKRDKGTWGSVGPYKPWKQKEIDTLSKNWNNVSLEDLSKLIGYRAEEGLKKQAKKIGLPPYDNERFKKQKK